MTFYISLAIGLIFHAQMRKKTIESAGLLSAIAENDKAERNFLLMILAQHCVCRSNKAVKNPIRNCRNCFRSEPAHIFEEVVPISCNLI